MFLTEEHFFHMVRALAFAIDVSFLVFLDFFISSSDCGELFLGSVKLSVDGFLCEKSVDSWLNN